MVDFFFFYFGWHHHGWYVATFGFSTFPLIQPYLSWDVKLSQPRYPAQPANPIKPCWSGTRHDLNRPLMQSDPLSSNTSKLIPFLQFGLLLELPVSKLVFTFNFIFTNNYKIHFPFIGMPTVYVGGPIHSQSLWASGLSKRLGHVILDCHDSWMHAGICSVEDKHNIET